MPPVIVKPSSDGLVLELMFGSFFGIVACLLGLVMGAWLFCGAAAVLVGLSVSRFCLGQREQIVFERDRVTVRTAFFQRSYPYEGMNVLIRRSSVIGWRGRSSGLAGTALALRNGNRMLVRIPVSWGMDNEAFRQAAEWVEGLPIPRRYL